MGKRFEDRAYAKENSRAGLGWSAACGKRRFCPTAVGPRSRTWSRTRAWTGRGDWRRDCGRYCGRAVGRAVLRSPASGVRCAAAGLLSAAAGLLLPAPAGLLPAAGLLSAAARLVAKRFFNTAPCPGGRCRWLARAAGCRVGSGKKSRMARRRQAPRPYAAKRPSRAHAPPGRGGFWKNKSLV